MTVFFNNGSGGGSWGNDPIKIPEGSKSGVIQDVKKAANNAVESVANSGPVRFFALIKENWQLAILGVVALLVLLRD